MCSLLWILVDLSGVSTAAGGSVLERWKRRLEGRESSGRNQRRGKEDRRGNTKERGIKGTGTMLHLMKRS